MGKGKGHAGPIATVIFVEVSVETSKRCETAMRDDTKTLLCRAQ